jgi:hypothetical protein
MKTQPSRKTYILLVTMLAIVLLAMIGGSTQAADEKWTANFWNNKHLEGDPVLTRWDQTIDFDWGHGSPAPVELTVLLPPWTTPCVSTSTAISSSTPGLTVKSTP